MILKAILSGAIIILIAIAIYFMRGDFLLLMLGLLIIGILATLFWGLFYLIVGTISGTLLDKFMGWKKCNPPRWVVKQVNNMVVDGSDFTTYLKGKTFKYRVRVSGWKSYNEKRKYWRVKRR